MTSYPPYRSSFEERKWISLHHVALIWSPRSHGRQTENYSTMFSIKIALLLVTILVGLCEGTHYANQWSVTIDGGDGVADSVAELHGFVNLGRVSDFAS